MIDPRDVVSKGHPLLKRFLGSVLALHALAAFASASPDSLPTVDEVVARYEQARGGYDKIKAIRTIVYRGMYHEGDYRGPATMALMRPYFKLVGDPEAASEASSEGYDGSAWEYYDEPGVILRVVGPASSALRHQAPIDGPLVDYRDRGTTISLQGSEDIAGRKAYALLVRMTDGFEEEEFVDAETWLCIASRKVAPIHAYGTAIKTETRFGEYRPVEGVLFPFSSQEVEIATGKVLNEMAWTSIAVNRDLRSTRFSPPIVSHTPLQQLLEQLYAERADVQAVLWSYREFRHAHPEIDTDNGMAFIGYQMLKMGDEPAALALLERNATAYPHSSGAAFGLGRAYRTAGRLAEARHQFGRALALDPQNERARDALRTLPEAQDPS